MMSERAGVPGSAPRGGDDDPAREPAGLRWRDLARPDGARLRLALAPPADGPAPALVLGLPGRGQFIERWFETIRALQDRGLAAAVLDHRGQGGSSRALADRGRHHIDDFTVMAEDALAAVHAVRAALHGGDRPVILLGHSMGALVAMLAACRKPRAVAGLVLAAPLIGLHAPAGLPASLVCAVAALQCRLGRATAYAWGQGPWRDPEADPAWHARRMRLFTHDARRYRLEAEAVRAHPALAVGGVTWGWLAAACRAMREVREPGCRSRITAPVLMVLAGAERVVSNRAARRLARRLPVARTVTIPGARHEILQESAPYRAAFWQAFDAFTAAHAREWGLP